MKKAIQSSWTNPLIGVVLCAVLLSFSFKPGAHSFQIYLDSKLVIEQYVNSKMVAPRVSLDPAKNYSQLIVKYSECGRTVTGRTITIKDERDRVLKEWRFDGSSSGYEGSMTCNVKDIISLKPQGGNSLKLFYSSADFPQGQQIATLVLDSGPKTALNK